MQYDPPISPYRGLIPFNEADASFFFGRERDIRRITNSLFASPLVVLYGANGVGKSSVLRAGVVRAMKQREDVIIATFNSWRYDPISGLEDAVREAIGPTRAGELNLDRSSSIVDFLSECAKRLENSFIIILDQFEEFFLYHGDDETGDYFGSELATVIRRRDLPVTLLVSIREDSLAKLDYFQERIPQLLDNRVRLEHLDRNHVMQSRSRWKHTTSLPPHVAR